MVKDHDTSRSASHEIPSPASSADSEASSELSDLEKQAVQGYGYAYLGEIVDIQELAPVHLKTYRKHLEASAPFAERKSSCDHDGFHHQSDDSLSSRRKSLDSLEASQPVLLSSNANPSGGFSHMRTTFTPLTHSIDSIDDLKTSRRANKTHDTFECFSHKIASGGYLDALTAAHPLPPLTTAKWRRDAEYIYCSTYRRLWAFAILVNVITFSAIVWRPYGSAAGLTYHQASIGTAANFLVAALARQEHVVNLLFRIACMLPRLTPLFIRRQAAQVYSYGGLHSGCGIGAFLWYVCFTVLLVKQFDGTSGESAALGPTTAIILAILLLVLCTSHPAIRKRWHNHWELSHRYGGWSAITLFWAQTIIMCISQAKQTHKPVAISLIEAPTFWVLSIISCCLVYPWMRLRRRKVETEKLSNHAVRLWFKDKKTLPTCVGHRLSTFPLGQNHGFAIIPNSDGQRGYSVVVSNAGDWTKKLIENPPTHIWTRGAPTKGVLRIATLFRPIVVVATGSGIGPCLSFLHVYSNYPIRILWSARSPELTYGCRIMNAVLQADRQAVIIDTRKTGHPDLVALTYALYRKIGAEAVVIISNASVTRQLVYEMETRKIAAFGPIFDS